MGIMEAINMTALPYIDTELHQDGMAETVRHMIEQEMKAFRPSRDYVAHIPVPELALEVRHSAAAIFRIALSRRVYIVAHKPLRSALRAPSPHLCRPRNYCNLR